LGYADSRQPIQMSGNAFRFVDVGIDDICAHDASETLVQSIIAFHAAIVQHLPSSIRVLVFLLGAADFLICGFCNGRDSRKKSPGLLE
jgi:hypothetical protein